MGWEGLQNLGLVLGVFLVSSYQTEHLVPLSEEQPLYVPGHLL